ncbi:hypothetical protein NIES37_73510 (plasmid) [Tolypothrix tenuis PCC 7101]|uniref:Uncharacterized protein n=1 Tax=Tolypothrix tenuis PCC 7101 TaxID=231146 RepID=A0A1Z4NC80_9CYAN|nr:hypothetical protein NIES37_73510 [Tolypothrix tenuis PCC 7101]BAZ78691.1 hypothetical protein NIES50_73240 [Aulosira laxa NIES-50]
MKEDYTLSPSFLSILSIDIHKKRMPPWTQLVSASCLAVREDKPQKNVFKFLYNPIVTVPMNSSNGFNEKFD